MNILLLGSGGREDALAWRTGHVVFNGVPLREAAERFAHYHGKAIRVDHHALLLRSLCARLRDLIKFWDEIIGLHAAIGHGERITVREEPVKHSARFAGTAKYGFRNRAFRAFIDLLAVRWMKKRYLRYQASEVQRDG